MQAHDRIIAVLGIIIGGLTSILQFLVAFGVDLTDAQTVSITSIAGLVLLAVSAWFHPDIPVGSSTDE